MSTLWAYDNAVVNTWGSITTQNVIKVWVDIPRAQAANIYGAATPKYALPHDHGMNRGKLLEMSILTLVLGPEAVSGSTEDTWTMGVPVLPPASGSFVTQPALMAQSPILIPAMATRVSGSICLFVANSGDRTYEFGIKIRPLGDAGRLPNTGMGPYKVASVTTTKVDEEIRIDFEFDDLSSLGDPGLDRGYWLVECYLVNDPTIPVITSGTTRFISISFTASVPVLSVNSSEPIGFWEFRELTPNDVHQNRIIFCSVPETAQIRQNQNIQAVLGKVPGQAQNLPVVDSEDPYFRIISQRHKHQGQLYIDPNTHRYKSDGAVPRTKPLFASCTFDNYGRTTDLLMSINPPKGIKLTPSGTILSAQGYLTYEVSPIVPIGLGAFDLIFALFPGHQKSSARVYFNLSVTDLSGTDILTGIFGGGLQNSNKAGSVASMIVEPIEGYLWNSKQQLLENGVSAWSQRAAVGPAPQDAGANHSLMPRISKTLSVGIRPPRTGRINIAMSWIVESGLIDSGTFETDASLAFVAGFVPYGY